MADTSHDLLVIGSGAGGLTAVIAAKLAGLDPLLIEKTPLVGGSSALSGGILWLPDNPLMKREGIADSREAALAYLANFVEGDPAWSTAARRETFVDTIAPMVAMLEGQGMQYSRCPGYSDYYDLLPGGNARGRAIQAALFDINRLGAWKTRLRAPHVALPIRTSEGASIMRLGLTLEGKLTAARVARRFLWGKLTGKRVYGSGGALQGRMLEIVLKLGIEIWTDTVFEGFDMAGGRVAGVHVTRDGREQTVRATRGVLVTAGGFSHNKAMREKYQRAPITNGWTSANPGDTGEAIEAMAALGADLALMEEAWWTPSFTPPGGPIEQIIPEMVKPHAILVDTRGKRFVNEANSYMEVGRAMFAHQAVPAWLVLDADARKRYFFGMRPPGRMPQDLLEKGLIRQDDTIAGLARRCGIDPAGLEATVARFNGFAAAGVDEDFRRGDSAFNRYYADPTNKPNASLGPIVKAPFWAVPLYPGDVGTCGGAVTNERTEVLRGDGSVIEGLYAAGNCAAPIAGHHYIGAGQSIATSSIFGYVAARQAAR